jgi:hypothetical protein
MPKYNPNETDREFRKRHLKQLIRDRRQVLKAKDKLTALQELKQLEIEEQAELVQKNKESGNGGASPLEDLIGTE